MNSLEKEFLQSIKVLDMLTPKDITLVENEAATPKHVQYCVNLNGVKYHIVVKKNGGEILSLGKGNERLIQIKHGTTLYQELKQKARVWYWDASLSDYIVVFNNSRCKVYLDIYSWIPPFVLKSVESTDTRFIGLDFLTTYSLINKE